MKVTIIGPGDYSLISKYCELDEKQVEELIDDFARFLAEDSIEIVIAVDRGIAYEVAKKYKEYGGKKVYRVKPKSHEKYKEGKEEAIKPYMEVIDKIIRVDSWYHLNGEIASLGDVAVSLGLSCGTMADIVFLYFHYKYLGGNTNLILFSPAMSRKLHPEVEEKLSVNGKKHEYVDSIGELKERIKEKQNDI